MLPVGRVHTDFLCLKLVRVLRRYIDQEYPRLLAHSDPDALWEAHKEYCTDHYVFSHSLLPMMTYRISSMYRTRSWNFMTRVQLRPFFVYYSPVLLRALALRLRAKLWARRLRRVRALHAQFRLLPACGPFPGGAHYRNALAHFHSVIQ